eukprot:g12443.t1
MLWVIRGYRALYADANRHADAWSGSVTLGLILAPSIAIHCSATPDLLRVLVFSDDESPESSDLVGLQVVVLLLLGSVVGLFFAAEYFLLKTMLTDPGTLPKQLQTEAAVDAFLKGPAVAGALAPNAERVLLSSSPKAEEDEINAATVRPAGTLILDLDDQFPRLCREPFGAPAAAEAGGEAAGRRSDRATSPRASQSASPKEGQTRGEANGGDEVVDEIRSEVEEDQDSDAELLDYDEYGEIKRPWLNKDPMTGRWVASYFETPPEIVCCIIGGNLTQMDRRSRRSNIYIMGEVAASGAAMSVQSGRG